MFDLHHKLVHHIVLFLYYKFDLLELIVLKVLFILIVKVYFVILKKITYSDMRKLLLIGFIDCHESTGFVIKYVDNYLNLLISIILIILLLKLGISDWAQSPIPIKIIYFNLKYF